MSKKLILCAALVVGLALTAAAPASASFASWTTMLTQAASKVEASMPAPTFSNVADSVDNYKRPDNAYYGKVALAMRALEAVSITGPGGSVTFGPYASDDSVETAIAGAYGPAGTVHGAPRIFDLGLLSTSSSSTSVTIAALQWADMEWAAANGHTTAAGLDFQGYASLSALGAFYATLGGEGIVNLAAWARYLPGIDAAFATSAQWVTELNTRLTAVSPSDALYAAGIGAAVPAFMQHGGTVQAVSWTNTLLTLQDVTGFFGSAANSTKLKAWNTALAICALETMSEQINASQISSGMDWLAANQTVAVGDDQYTWGGANTMERLRIAAFVIDCGRLAIVDAVAPSVALTAPSPGQAICGTGALSATASDNVEVDRVVFKVDASVVATVIGAGPTYDATVATGAFADGPHTVSATAYDDNGNTGSSSAAVVVDNTAPNAPAITSPGSPKRGTVAVSIDASDVTPGSGICSVTLYDGTQVVGTDTSAPWSISWNTANPAFGGDGTHTLTAVAADCCANLSATSPAVMVLVDNTPPSCALVAPSPGAFVSGTVSLQADATDANAGVTVGFKVDAAVVGTDTTESGGSPTHDYSWNSASVPDGTKALTAVASDAAGNTTTSAYRLIIVDNTGPTVTLDSPADNEVISGSSVVLTATASDAQFGVANVKFYYQQPPGALTLISQDNSAPYASSALDTTALNDGTIALSAVATSAGGNSNSATDTNVAIIDNLAPGIVFTAPAPAAVVGGAAVTVSVDASDAGAGISLVTFYRDGTTMGDVIGTDAVAPYSISWNSTSVSNGAHTLYAKAEDLTAKTTIANVSITVENGVGPSLTWIAPAPNFIVNGTAVTLSVDSTDNNSVAKVEFYLDTIVGGNKIGEDTSASPPSPTHSIVWNTKTQPAPGPTSDGAHVLWARAIDGVANQTDASRAVRVDNQAPGLSFVSPPTPLAGATVTGTLTPLAPAQVTIRVDATDYNLSGVASVTIQVNHLSPGLPFVTFGPVVDNAAPYEATWATDYLDNGVNEIRVTAVDALGNTTATTLTRTVNVNNRSFTDVNFGDFGWQQIERIVRVGITAGCATSPAQYCPAFSVTRAQMAAFLCRAKGWTWLDASPPTFADVPKTNSFFGFVERLVAQGVTAGCATGPAQYCPNEYVTRAQMAAFLCRALGLSQYLPPVATFNDVPIGNSFRGYVERIYLVGITTGCALTPGFNYCPNNTVTRAEMAVFLVRAFSIPGPP